MIHAKVLNRELLFNFLKHNGRATPTPTTNLLVFTQLRGLLAVGELLQNFLTLLACCSLCGLGGSIRGGVLTTELFKRLFQVACILRLNNLQLANRKDALVVARPVSVDLSAKHATQHLFDEVTAVRAQNASDWEKIQT